jgi:hypothetical protein
MQSISVLIPFCPNYQLEHSDELIVGSINVNEGGVSIIKKEMVSKISKRLSAIYGLKNMKPQHDAGRISGDM